jgi:hypothetical protein
MVEVPDHRYRGFEIKLLSYNALAFSWAHANMEALLETLGSSRTRTFAGSCKFTTYGCSS